VATCIVMAEIRHHIVVQRPQTRKKSGWFLGGTGRTRRVRRSNQSSGHGRGGSEGEIKRPQLGKKKFRGKREP